MGLKFLLKFWLQQHSAEACGPRTSEGTFLVVGFNVHFLTDSKPNHGVARTRILVFCKHESYYNVFTLHINSESFSILTWSSGSHEDVHAGHGSSKDASRVVVAPADGGNNEVVD